MKFCSAEFIRYIIAGASTTLLNAGLYTLLLLIGVQYYNANLAAIIITKIYAYFINKIYVYRSNCSSNKEQVAQVCKFAVTRGGTGIFDYFAVLFLVEVFGMSKYFAKYFTMAVVILLNYWLGKRYVFKHKEMQND